MASLLDNPCFLGTVEQPLPVPGGLRRPNSVVFLTSEMLLR